MLKKQKLSYLAQKINILRFKAIVESAMFLGVIFDSKLTWSVHINHVVSKLSKVVGVVMQIRHCLSQKSLLHIYYALFYSSVYYCLLVYGTASASVLDPIFKLQKRFVRIIENTDMLSPSLPIFKKHNIIPIPHLYKMKILRILHTTHKNYRSYHELCNLTVKRNVYSIRHGSVYDVPYTRCNYIQQSLTYRAPVIINTYANTFNSCSSTYALKKMLKTVLIHTFIA